MNIGCTIAHRAHKGGVYELNDRRFVVIARAEQVDDVFETWFPIAVAFFLLVFEHRAITAFESIVTVVSDVQRIGQKGRGYDDRIDAVSQRLCRSEEHTSELQSRGHL